MKDIIKKEALEWYGNVQNHDDESIENFVELVVNKTTDVLFEEIKKQFKDEFLCGNLKHNFVISPDYYIELKLKAVKENFSKDSFEIAEETY
jgi:hypothetical protein